MGGRGSRATGTSSSSKSKVITPKQWAEMPQRVKVKIALKKKVKAGTATKADIKSLKNLDDMYVQQKGYKNKKDYDNHAEDRKRALERNRMQEAHARERWAKVTTTTYERFEKNRRRKFDEWYWKGRGGS